MALTGYTNRCVKNSGGIKSIRLIEIGKITGANYSPATDSYGSFTLETGAAFADYQFKENEALYSEQVSLESGSPRVSHELTLIMDQTDSMARSALKQLVEASQDGMVAIIGMNNGESLAVGYSENFHGERPLKLLRAVSASGTRPTEHTAQILYLHSEDTQAAKAYII